MFTTEQLTGSHLPSKTLCLTYDDGPGENTPAIARFLYEQGIRATFFVVGKYAAHHIDTLAALQAMGHIIANHTYEHPDLPYYMSVNGDVQNQVLRTDAIIAAYCKAPRFFRAPYGKWSAEVAAELNHSPLCAIHHVGPVHWDIDGIDCYYWQQGKSVADALVTYLANIEKAGKGIVVMHDEIADMDIVKPGNQTLQLTRQLIPILKERGYRFIGLDEVFPAAESKTLIKLQTADKRYLSLQPTNNLAALARKADENTIIVMEQSGEGTVLLKAANGCYLVLGSGNQVMASQTHLSEQAQFHLIPVYDNHVMLRTFNGHFLTIEKQGSLLTASAPFMRQAAIFSCQHLPLEIRKPFSLKKRYQLLKKRVAFITSKLLHQ